MAPMHKTLLLIVCLTSLASAADEINLYGDTLVYAVGDVMYIIKVPVKQPARTYPRPVDEPTTREATNYCQSAVVYTCPPTKNATPSVSKPKPKRVQPVIVQEPPQVVGTLGFGLRLTR